jgi:broad specificity phosphatase PhoE
MDLIRRAMFAPAEIKAKWPSCITIVRHGQSLQNFLLSHLDENTTSTYQTPYSRIRDYDMPLTNRGRWQAEQTGAFLASHPPFDICFASPYLRTRQTAAAIISQFAQPLVRFDPGSMN